MAVKSQGRAGGPPVPERRNMALHVGLLLAWVCPRLSVVGQLNKDGEEHGESTVTVSGVGHLKTRS